MKHLLMMPVIALLAITIAFAQKPIKPASVYKQDGVTFTSPNQPGWTLLKSDKTETVFEKRAADEVSNASVKIIKTQAFETDKERLMGFEAMKTQELSSLDRDSIHFNYLRFKDSMCLEYDGIFKAEAASPLKLEEFHIKGYLCPHPTIKDWAIQLEFTNYSNTRNISEDFSTLRDKFFEKAAFLKTK